MKTRKIVTQHSSDLFLCPVPDGPTTRPTFCERSRLSGLIGAAADQPMTSHRVAQRLAGIFSLPLRLSTVMWAFVFSQRVFRRVIFNQTSRSLQTALTQSHAASAAVMSSLERVCSSVTSLENHQTRPVMSCRGGCWPAPMWDASEDVGWFHVHDVTDEHVGVWNVWLLA